MGLGGVGMVAKPHTPETLAAVWGCSPNHIRNLVRRGELRAFRLGPRLIRIPAAAVEEFEHCQMNTALEGSTEDSSFPGGSMENEGVIVLTHSPRRMRSAKHST